MLYDTGSMVNLMNKSVALDMGLRTCPTDVILEYADGSKAACSRRTVSQRVTIQGGSFHEQFLVAEADVPGVDVVLGTGFAERSGSTLIWPAEGSTDVPYLSFNDGTRWYGENVMGSDSDQTSFVHTINAAEVKRFCRSVKGNFQVLAVSVEDLMKAGAGAGETPAAPVQCDIPEPIKLLLKKYAHIFRDNLPLDLPQKLKN